MSRRRNSFFFTGALALVALAAHGVPRLEPPTRFLQSDERYRVAVAKIAEMTEDGRYRLAVQEQLRGETPDGLVVRVLGGGDAGLEMGETYIVGHTDKPGRRSYRWKTDPAGARFLGIPAVGPAIFTDTPAMRTLVRSRSEEEPLGDGERLAAVLDLLESGDSSSQRFVSAELALDAELRATAGEEDLERLRAVLAAGALDTAAHDYFLRAALPMVDAWGGDWLAADARRLVSSHGAELDLASFVPALLVTALRTLEVAGDPQDAERVRTHVASNNPGVGKAAFQALVVLDRSLAGKVAVSVAESEVIHPDTRRFVAETAARESLSTDAG